MKIFWSWQSDIDGKISRHFIKECLTEAIKEISNEISLDERLEIDHDTKGVLGSPSITDTILQKITESDLFIGDVTPIALAENGKKVMNPNVAIEMGYAISEKGDNNIITIMNTAFGTLPDDLPFDLRHKRGAIPYLLENQASKEQISNEKKELIKIFKEIIKEYLSSAVTKDLKNDLNLDSNDLGIFFDINKPILRMPSDFWGVINDREISVKMKSSYIYVRILPQKKKIVRKIDLQGFMYSATQFRIRPLFGTPDNTPIPNIFGSITFTFDHANPNYISDLVQVFENTNVIGISNSFLHYSNSGNKLFLIPLREGLKKFLNEGLLLLQNIYKSADLDTKIEIGLINKDKFLLVLPDPIGQRYVNGGVYGPLEKESYKKEYIINIGGINKVDEIIKEFVLFLVNDLGKEFDYENHQWE